MAPVRRSHCIGDSARDSRDRYRRSTAPVSRRVAWRDDKVGRLGSRTRRPGHRVDRRWGRAARCGRSPKSSDHLTAEGPDCTIARSSCRQHRQHQWETPHRAGSRIRSAPDSARHPCSSYCRPAHGRHSHNRHCPGSLKPHPGCRGVPLCSARHIHQGLRRSRRRSWAGRDRVPDQAAGRAQGQAQDRRPRLESCTAPPRYRVDCQDRRPDG